VSCVVGRRRILSCGSFASSTSVFRYAQNRKVSLLNDTTHFFLKISVIISALGIHPYKGAERLLDTQSIVSPKPNS
jgi:hypothetical protein